MFTHDIIWRADSDDAIEAKSVSSLSIGDQVGLDAWAAVSGWINFIQKASITLL